MAVEDTWRYVAAAVLYGLLIVLSLATPLGCWFGTWPRLTALLAALLWLCVALLMAVGTGVLRGVEVASGNACLFAESYVLEIATTKLAGSQWQDTALRMLRFYLGLDAAPQTSSPELAPLLAWLPSDTATTVQTVYSGLPALESEVTQLYELSQQPGVQGKLGSAVAGAIQQSSSAVVTVTAALRELLSLASKDNSDRIYHGAKTYMRACCLPCLPCLPSPLLRPAGLGAGAVGVVDHYWLPGAGAGAAVQRPAGPGCPVGTQGGA
ncbi:hypothetical protein ABPG75_001971 [Micractinium tetrahymenae]